MSLAIIFSRACAGVAAPLVTVETHLARGLPAFQIVGLPEAAVKESKYRVRSALLNAGFEFPRARITVNLAPADLPKEGGRFDLPIALGILAASSQLRATTLADYEFTGELALSGDIRAVRGVLPMVLSARESGRQLIVPAANAEEAALVQTTTVRAAKHLLEVCAYLNATGTLPRCELAAPLVPAQWSLDMAEVRGQAFAKRALEIAAAGQHSLLFIGPPGTGKTMLASRLPSLLPQLSEADALEVAALASISQGGFDCQAWQRLPFRAPHHTASSPALVGGGRPPRPGEISLAHKGVLFLDELPEFNRQVLEALREPLESGTITIARAANNVTFPAQFQLIAAMNPCPCGYAGSDTNYCHCTEEQVQRYLGKLSGPLLDRIDMQVSVPALPSSLLVSQVKQPETSAVVRDRIAAARLIQNKRQHKTNGELTVPDIERLCILHAEAQQLMTAAMDKFKLSARVYHRLLKLARTIADLAAAPTISAEHISEALAYRTLDRAKTMV